MSLPFRRATEDDLERLIWYLDTERVGKEILSELAEWAVLDKNNVVFISIDDMLNHFDEHIADGRP